MCSAPSVIDRASSSRWTPPPPASIGALGHRQLDLDRREHLPDFVVQLARDAAPLLFLGGDQLGGQLLELAGVLAVL